MKKLRSVSIKSVRYACLLCVIAVGLVSIIATGGDNGDNGGGGNGNDGGEVPIEGLLEGSPSSLASAAVKDLDSGDRVSDAEITTDPSGARVVRTKVEIAFSENATVGEINALLESVDGSITSMLEGVNLIVVRIPDPGSLDGLDAVISQLEADPSVRYVRKLFMPVQAELPGNYTAGTSDLSLIDHHLAVRAHAAWNARAALQHPLSIPPLLIVHDWFGDGPPNSDFDVNSTPSEFGIGKPESHGYHVLGIISAKYGGGSSQRGLATGIYPGTLDLYVVDSKTGLDPATAENLIIIRTKISDKNVVVNTSLAHQFPCEDLYSECMAPLASNWIEKIRGSVLYETGKTGAASLENKFLHFSSAGNIGQGHPSPEAGLNSYYNAARLMPGLDTGKGVSLDNLNNTLVIENRYNSPDQPDQAYEAHCLNTTDVPSKYPGDLSAVGTDVFSLMGSSSGADNKTGTSMASPQAAGLAAYVWALKPGLTPQDLLSLLTTTARDYYYCLGTVTPKPVIDAYNAVLAVDDASALEAGILTWARVRIAILDVVDADGNLGGNGAFDERDIEWFLQEYAATPSEPDYSRFDLNGDGWTGGGCDRTEKFNLDIDYPPTYDSITQNIQGDTVTFDEANVSDMHVLCYYAYSPIYTGDEALRDAIMASHLGECAACGGEEPPPAPWSTKPQILLRGDSVGTRAVVHGEVRYTQDCGSNQVSRLEGISTRSEGCTTCLPTCEYGRVETEIEPVFLGSLEENWSSTAAWEGGILATATSVGSSGVTVTITDDELIIQGSFDAQASVTSEGYNGESETGANFRVQFHVYEPVDYELTWSCNLSRVSFYRLTDTGSEFIVDNPINSAYPWLIDSCEGASGSSRSGTYSLTVNATAAVYTSGESSESRTRGGSFQLIMRPQAE